MPLDRLAKQAKVGVRDAGGFPIEFVTIAVSDGISMGHEGMHACLVSREVIADSVETVMHAERFDALVTFAGCDKSLPGMLMAAARLNLPSVFLYGGSILPGHGGEGRGPRHRLACSRRLGPTPPAVSPRRSCRYIERHACPTEGSCAGMFTANTMASVAEAIGMSLPGSASPPAVDPRRDDFARRSGEAVIRLLEQNIRPRQILTKEAFENAIAVVMALGGSTNAVLHLLAIANEARVELELDDFNRVGARVPHIADMKPHGKYHMVDLDRVGGVPVVMKELLDAGLLHGDCLTVTGKTMAENLAELDPPKPDGDVVHPVVAADPRRRRHRRPARLAGAEGARGEGRGHRHHSLRGHGARVRRRGRRAWRRSWPAPSSPAPSSSSATRGRRAGRACARCSPSPAP